MKLENIKEHLWNRDTSIRWLLFFAALILVTMLGARELWTQEWRWADISWNMMYRGDYLHPYLGDAPYYDKPLLSYWLMIAFSYLMGGLSEWSLRLPAVLAGILAVFCTYKVGTQLLDRKVGLMAGWMLITTFYFIFWGRTGNTDMLNVASIMLGVAWYVTRRETPGFSSYSIFFLILAVGALFKGLVAVVITTLAILPDLLHNKTWRKHLRWSLIPAAVPALIVYLIPFLASTYFDGQQAYGESGLYFVYRENILRYFQPFDHQDPFYIYFIYLPVYLFPWIVFFIPALGSLYKRWTKMPWESRWLVWSVLIIFLFLTLSGSRRNYYVLPLVPFAILLTADWIVTGIKRSALAFYTLIVSYVVLFSYFCILTPLANSNGGSRPFAHEVHTEAALIKPWSQWHLVFLDAESKLTLYMQPAFPVKMLGLPPDPPGMPERTRATFYGPELIKLWPIVTTHPTDTIFITRKIYVNELKPWLKDYKVIIAKSTLSEKLFEKDDSDNAAAFIPTKP